MTLLTLPRPVFALGLAALLALPLAAQAQGDTGKKALVAKILQLQQPGIDQLARQLAEQPAAAVWQQAAAAAQQRIPPEQREAVGKKVEAEVKKYTDAVVPQVREAANKHAPSVIGSMLEEKFTEDELKQIVGILESPVNKRFQALAPEMQRGLTEKLVADTRASVQPKVQAMEQAVAQIMNTALKAAASASAPAKPAAKSK